MSQHNEQINKIVANALIKNQAIFIPSLGSLWVETLGSKFNSSKGEMTPPKYVVRFSSQQKGVSIIDIITSAAGVNAHGAGDMFGTWLESIATPNGFNIEGVGAVANKNFTISPTLDKLLNPEAQHAIKLQRRRGGWIWIAASIVVCVVVGLCANYGIQWYLSKPQTPKVAEVMVAVPEEVVVAPEESADTTEMTVIEDIAQEIDPTQRLTCTAPPAEVRNPRYRVVYGVFSTEQNAQKGAKLAYDTNNQIISEIRPYGNKFMVSIFGADDITDAKAFIDRNNMVYSDLWIYKRRGE